MKVIAIIMCLNEEDFIYRNLFNHYDLIDEILLFEGTVNPSNILPEHSTDNTIKEINRFIIENDKANKIRFWSPNKNISFHDRQSYEGWIKNELLKKSNIENGDLLWMIDADEYYIQENANNIIKMFRKNDKLENVIVEEWQHAYKIGLAFQASHQGRFIRYKKGAFYTASQHFFYPNDKRDISKVGPTLSRDFTGFHHLSFVRHPFLIRDRVIGFNRLSFTSWYNHCYLTWPFSPEAAYQNNIAISQANGWPGTGFAEGQTEKLQVFSGKLPSIIMDYKVDYLDFIRNNFEKLIIK